MPRGRVMMMEWDTIFETFVWTPDATYERDMLKLGRTAAEFLYHEDYTLLDPGALVEV
jgi:hypothetical protein